MIRNQYYIVEFILILLLASKYSVKDVSKAVRKIISPPLIRVRILKKKII